MTTRRQFLRRSLLAAAAPPARRPNILFSIADDHSHPHTGSYGCRFTRTPAFDRVAREGVLFRHAFVSTPSCCPSRGSILAGQDFYRLREASMNHTIWPGGIPLYPDLLAEAGYHAGYTGKGWGPGNWKVSGRPFSPAGPEYNQARLTPPGKYISNIDYAANFRAFLARRPPDAPFCFWAGFTEPHREYESGIGRRHGKRLGDIEVPGFLPDSREVRSDLADYAFEIEWCDRQLAALLKILEDRGELDNTLVVVTADNGMPFPRAKANLYDYGVRMPLAIRWGARAKPGRVIDDFVSFPDFAPTFLEAAGLPAPAAMTGRSLLPLLSGQVDPRRDHAVFGIERHFPGSREGGAGYPSRAFRTKDYLYIRNLTPDRTPAGDRPGPTYPADEPVGGFGDTDGGPSKTFLWQHRDKYPELFRLSFERRPAEELYAVRDDPYSLRNLAADPRHAAVKKDLAARLDRHLARTEDPRATGRGHLLDEVMTRYPALPASAPPA